MTSQRMVNNTIHAKEVGTMRNTRNSLKIKHAMLASVAAVAALAMASRQTLAASTDFTLTNQNSSVSINPNGDPSVADGLYGWSVDGVSQVAEGRVGQGYYIGVNGGTPLPLAAWTFPRRPPCNCNHLVAAGTITPR